MLGILLIVIVVIYLDFLFPLFRAKKDESEDRSPRYDQQMKKLWTAAQTSMRDHKPLRAEKALLTILKFDEKNAAAYNRLGILYAKGQKYSEAIECFEIAQSLDNNPSSLHNVGLIYLETGDYEKAVMAFHQALELERDVPARFIALAKAEEKMGRLKASVEALEEAYKLDHSINTLRQILAIHELAGDSDAIADTTARIEAQITKTATSSKTPKAPKTTRRTAKATTAKTSAATATTARRAPATSGTARATRSATTATTAVRRAAPTPSRATTAAAPRAAQPRIVTTPRPTVVRTTAPMPRATSAAAARARAASAARAASGRMSTAASLRARKTKNL